jgi:hypothetical protein
MEKAPLIVKGAKLFVTTLTREVLFKEAGAIKYVITRSLTLNASLPLSILQNRCCHALLTEAEFFKTTRKLPRQVLEKYRDLAGKWKPSSLFHEFDNHHGSTPTSQSSHISETRSTRPWM